MEYIVYMEKHGDIFTEDFETEAEAIQRSEYLFEHLTDYDRKQYVTFCVIKPYAPDTFDGDIVRRWKCQRHRKEHRRSTTKPTEKTFV